VYFLFVFEKLLATLMHFIGVGHIFGQPRSQMYSNRYLEEYYATYSPPKMILYVKTFIEHELPQSDSKKVDWKFRQLSKRIIPEAFVLRLTNATVYANGSVVTSEKILLRDLSREFGRLSKHSAFKKICLHQPHRIPGNVAVLITEGANTYYHWLFDIIPRIHLIKKAGLFNDIDFFLLPSINHPYQREIIELLKIPSEKIIELTANKKHIADNLFAPSLPSLLGTVNGWVLKFLREAFIKVEPERMQGHSKRIYISRRNANNRRLLNEVEIMNTLYDYGFEEIVAENFTFADQVEIFSNAEVVIAPHGSGLSNIAFCKQGTVIIDLFWGNFMVPCFWIIAAQLQLKYFYSSTNVSTIEDFAPYWVNKGSNGYFPVEKLLSALKLAGINK